MAKEKKSKEQIELEQKEAAEKAELEKLKKAEDALKLKRLKEREKRKKKRLNAEKNRVTAILNFPFKLLWQSSLLVTLFGFLVIFFWLENPIEKALLYTFVVFTVCYFGFGLVMVAFYLILSKDKEIELNERIKAEEDRKQKEEEDKKRQEIEELEALEEELRQKRNRKEEISQQNFDENNIEYGEDLDNPELLKTPKEEFELPDDDDFKDNNLNDEDSYLDELLGKEFNN